MIANAILDVGIFICLALCGKGLIAALLEAFDRINFYTDEEQPLAPEVEASPHARTILTLDFYNSTGE